MLYDRKPHDISNIQHIVTDPYWLPIFHPNSFFLLKINYPSVLTINHEMVKVKEKGEESAAVIWQLT